MAEGLCTLQSGPQLLTPRAAAGVIGGLVAYIVSNGINWFLDYCEDAWDRWRHVGDGSSSGDADDDKAPHGTFGRGSSGPGTQRLSIGDRRSLERWAPGSGARGQDCQDWEEPSHCRQPVGIAQGAACHGAAAAPLAS